MAPTDFAGDLLVDTTANSSTSIPERGGCERAAASDIRPRATDSSSGDSEKDALLRDDVLLECDVRITKAALFRVCDEGVGMFVSSRMGMFISSGKGMFGSSKRDAAAALSASKGAPSRS
jgi:hypothetical protein